MNPYQILEELKKAYPDRLPRPHDYSEQSVLMAIGRQEVIRLFECILERSN